jgi:putative transcriptional regulator
VIRFRLRELLQERGISERQFAIQNKIREGSLYDMCNNVTTKRLHVAFIDRICTALECGPGDFIEWVPDDIVNPEK